MGIYVNPQNKSKEVWIQENVKRTYGRTPPSSLSDLDSDEALICLVDNGMFTAAAVAYSDNELRCFSELGDDRPKAWFTVCKESLKQECEDYRNFTQ